VARGAQNAMMLTLAKELAPFSISVNAIAPNYIETPAYFPPSITQNPAAMKKMLANVPLNVWALPTNWQLPSNLLQLAIVAS